MLHPPVSETPKRSDPTKAPPELTRERSLHPRASGWTQAVPVWSSRNRGSGTQSLQRKCACGGTGECTSCKDEHETMLHRAAAGPGPAMAPPIVHEVLRAPGSSLDGAARAFLEPRFGRDFSHVRVHTDGTAARSAAAVGAHAYAVGHNVVFGANRYAPNTPEGSRLLAHELSHVVQQDGAPAPAAGHLKIGAADAAEEREADAMAAHSNRGEAPVLRAFTNASAQSLRRSVVVDPPGKASEILGYFNFLCPGNFAVSGANITQSCTASTNMSCECLCDVAGDPARTYTIHVGPSTIGTRSATLFDGSTATIPNTSLFPTTTPGTNPDIQFPAASSNTEFGSFLPSGSGAWAPLWRVLAHELCGHARLNQSYAGSTGNRAGHDSTIDTENAIAAEHGGPARGHFSDPRQGESFFNEAGKRGKVVYSLVNGLHFDPP